MGIRRRTYYSVECNHCGEDLEDFLDKFFKDEGINLSKIADTKEKAAEIAEKYGWCCIGKNSWRCMDCKDDWND